MTPRRFPHRYTHWTETDERIHQFLWEKFGEYPDVSPQGPDLHVLDTTIEVKSCAEYTKTNHAKYSKQRRGRFQLHGYEHADYILFVLVCQDELRMRMLKTSTIKRRFHLTGETSIVWTKLFRKGV